MKEIIRWPSNALDHLILYGWEMALKATEKIPGEPSEDSALFSLAQGMRNITVPFLVPKYKGAKSLFSFL